MFLETLPEGILNPELSTYSFIKSSHLLGYPVPGTVLGSRTRWLFRGGTRLSQVTKLSGKHREGEEQSALLEPRISPVSSVLWQ